MREILVYDDYEIHKLGAGGGTQYEEVTTEKATSIYVTDVAKPKGKLIPFGRTTQDGEPTPENPQEIENVEGRRLEFNVCNKNLFDENTVEFIESLLDDNGQPITGSSHYTANFYKVQPNTTYSILGTTTADSISKRIYFYNKNKEWISRSQLMGPLARRFITPDDCYFIRLQVPKTITLKTGDVMLCEGTDNTYVEHKQQLISFPLQDGQKLMEGDYLAEDGVHHLKKQVEVNITSITTNSEGKSARAFNTPDKIKRVNYNIKCTNATMTKDTSPNRIVENQVNFVLVGDVGDTLETMQQKFNGAIVEYELLEEVIEPYTEAQQEAYNKLKNLKLYKGVNHIWTETENLEPNLQLTYKRIKTNETLQVNNIQPLNLELNNIEETPEEITTETSEE